MHNTILSEVVNWFTPTGFVQPNTPALREKYAKLKAAIGDELSSVIESQEDEIYSVTVTNGYATYLTYAYRQEGIWYTQSTNIAIDGSVTINHGA
jgi:hypothetical protein